MSRPKPDQLVIARQRRYSYEVVIHSRRWNNSEWGYTTGCGIRMADRGQHWWHTYTKIFNAAFLRFCRRCWA